jgi:hypothetical protein
MNLDKCPLCQFPLKTYGSSDFKCSKYSYVRELHFVNGSNTICYYHNVHNGKISHYTLAMRKNFSRLDLSITYYTGMNSPTILSLNNSKLIKNIFMKLTSVEQLQKVVDNLILLK